MCQSDEDYVAQKRAEGQTDADLAADFFGFGYEKHEVEALGIKVEPVDTPATSLGANAAFQTESPESERESVPTA